MPKEVQPIKVAIRTEEEWIKWYVMANVDEDPRLSGVEVARIHRKIIDDMDDFSTEFVTTLGDLIASHACRVTFGVSPTRTETRPASEPRA